MIERGFVQIGELLVEGLCPWSRQLQMGTRMVTEMRNVCAVHCIPTASFSELFPISCNWKDIVSTKCTSGS